MWLASSVQHSLLQAWWLPNAPILPDRELESKLTMVRLLTVLFLFVLVIPRRSQYLGHQAG